MVWDNWDLRGCALPCFKCTTSWELEGAAPACVALKYSMTRGPRGQSRGRITLETDLSGIASLADTDLLYIGLRITVPWARFDKVYIYAVAPEVLRRGAIRRRWRIKPYSGLAIVSGIITRGRSPGSNNDWPVTHLLPPL